ncbi:MAG: rod shape-determining protein RodA [Planctomycetes bacterium]|nr:rod shape-determining protein RodA [Planctomycetota bacterium]
MKRSTFDLTQPGWSILLAITVLMAIGVASIYVTDTHYAAGHDGPQNAAKQVVRALVSVIAAMIVLKLGYLRIAHFAYVIFGVVLIGLVPLVVAKKLNTTFGGLIPEINGAFRWIRMPGFPIQPSEFMKLAYILLLAWYLRNRKSYRRFSGLMLPFLMALVPAGLILLEPDLGTVILLGVVLFVMLFVAGAKIWHLTVIIMMGAAVAPFAWDQITGYQRARITAVLLQNDGLRRAVIEEPERYRKLATKRQALEWAASSGYQLVHSKNALGSGGFFGYGWGRGTYVQNNRLPDRHNDFIFAIVGHQWGFVGCLVVLGCYMTIAVAGVMIAWANTEPVGRLLAVGVVTLIAAQVVINVGMTVGLMPITGMNLPFLSYGGSSLLTNFIAVGLLVSVSQHRPFQLSAKPFEFGRPRKRAMATEHGWRKDGRCPACRYDLTGNTSGVCPECGKRIELM